MSTLSQSQLGRLQQIEFEILVEFDRVCKLLGLNYFLDGGTTLGAARHNGFIPWDDDIDVGMLRSDYAVFLENAPNLLAEEFFLQTTHTDPGAQQSFAKIRKNGTVYLENNIVGRNVHSGVWIDIFPFDWIDASPRSVKRAEKDWRIWHRLMVWRTVDRASIESPVYKKIIRFLIRIPLCVRDKKYYYDKLDSLAKKYAPQNNNRVLVCFHYYTCLPVLKEDDIYPLTSLPFEGKRFPVFANWESYLENVYGDWKSLPPEDKRCSHHQVISVYLPEESDR